MYVDDLDLLNYIREDRPDAKFQVDGNSVQMVGVSDPDFMRLLENARQRKLHLLKNYYRSEIIAFADEIASRPDVAGAYPQSEKEGWPTKLAAAEAHLAGSASQMQTDMLMTEANIVGITVDQLAQAIVAKAAWFAKVNATISGMRQKAFAAIDAATDQAGVDAVLEQMKLDAEKALADLLASKP